jgi:hypothetical protein
LCRDACRRIALNSIDLRIEKGRIPGLTGRKGAASAAVLNAILGHTSSQAELKVLGCDPSTERDPLLRDVCFFAVVGGDTALDGTRRLCVKTNEYEPGGMDQLLRQHFGYRQYACSGRHRLPEVRWQTRNDPQRSQSTIGSICR